MITVRNDWGTGNWHSTRQLDHRKVGKLVRGIGRPDSVPIQARCSPAASTAAAKRGIQRRETDPEFPQRYGLGTGTLVAGSNKDGGMSRKVVDSISRGKKPIYTSLAPSRVKSLILPVHTSLFGVARDLRIFIYPNPNTDIYPSKTLWFNSNPISPTICLI